LYVVKYNHDLIKVIVVVIVAVGGGGVVVVAVVARYIHTDFTFLLYYSANY